jgi:hypothetical protein
MKISEEVTNRGGMLLWHQLRIIFSDLESDVSAVRKDMPVLLRDQHWYLPAGIDVADEALCELIKARWSEIDMLLFEMDLDVRICCWAAECVSIADEERSYRVLEVVECVCRWYSGHAGWK